MIPLGDHELDIFVTGIGTSMDAPGDARMTVQNLWEKASLQKRLRLNSILKDKMNCAVSLISCFCEFHKGLPWQHGTRKQCSAGTG